MGTRFRLAGQHHTSGSVHFRGYGPAAIVQLLAAGQEVYGALHNLCIWAKDKGWHGIALQVSAAFQPEREMDRALDTIVKIHLVWCLERMLYEDGSSLPEPGLPACFRLCFYLELDVIADRALWRWPGYRRLLRAWPGVYCGTGSCALAWQVGGIIPDQCCRRHSSGVSLKLRHYGISLRSNRVAVAAGSSGSALHSFSAHARENSAQSTVVGNLKPNCGSSRNSRGDWNTKQQD